MPTSLNQVQPPLTFVPPAFNPLVYQAMRLIMPFYRRFKTPVVDISIANGEVLAQLFQQFQQGNNRILLAFRHPTTHDPICVAHMLWRDIPEIARQKGIALDPKGVHAHFMYDRGIPLWAGQFVGWIYSRLGCTPIRRGKVDLMGLRSARNLFLNGQFPLAAAPEGANNGHNEIISPLEPGIAQLAFWCVEDLQKEGRSQPVVMVPIGVQYYFRGSPWPALERLLQQLELDNRLPPDPIPGLLQNDVDLTPEQQTNLYRRLLRLGEHLLVQMEEFYRKFYHQPIPKHQPLDNASPTALNESLAMRLPALLDTALSVAETHFGMAAKGGITDRCRRLEQAGWDWIFREDIKNLEALSPVQRGLADRIAEEADLRMWHMRLVESFVSVSGRYVLEKPTADRFGDTLLILWDTVTRIKGQPTFPRPFLGAQQATLTIGDPISVSDRWTDYQVNRRQAVTTLTQDLQKALESTIQH